MESILTAALIAYGVLYIIKLINALEALPYVVSAVSVRETGQPWSWVWFTIFVVVIPIAVLVLVIPALVTERRQFFVSYRRFTLLRDIVKATPR